MLLVVSAASQPPGLRAVGQHWGVSGAGRAEAGMCPFAPSASLND